MAAAWVEKYVGTEYAKAAIGEVADEWAERDAASAVSWVAGLPPGETRSNAFSEVFREWTERDAFTAADYLVTMPNGKDRDAATDALSRRHVGTEPFQLGQLLGDLIGPGRNGEKQQQTGKQAGVSVHDRFVFSAKTRRRQEHISVSGGDDAPPSRIC